MILTRRGFLRSIVPAAIAAPVLLEELLHPGRVFFLPPAAGLPVWRVNSLGGYLYSQQLSAILRAQVAPLVKFRPIDFGRAKTERELVHASLFPHQTFRVDEGLFDQVLRGRFVPLDQLVRQQG